MRSASFSCEYALANHTRGHLIVCRGFLCVFVYMLPMNGGVLRRVCIQDSEHLKHGDNALVNVNDSP